MNGPRQNLVICLLLAALVSAVFWQVVTFSFVNFDDPIYILENRHIQQGLNLAMAKWAFTTHLHGHFHPLTWLSHAADYQLFGLDPAGHHFSGFLLHLVNTLLLFMALRKMTGAAWPSGIAAALFAVHPLHVEPVAWVADRKDLLCGFFWILSLWVYARAVETKSPWYLLLLMTTYFLGLLSKTMMITLPLVLLVLDIWPLQRFRTAMAKPGRTGFIAPAARILLEKSVLLLIAGLFVLISTGAMQDLRVEAKTLSPYWQYDFLLFLLHYLEKFIWPVRLTVLYPYIEQPVMTVLVLSAVLLTCLTLIAFLLRKRFPFLLTGWLWFVITLLPVSGIIHDGPHRVADRYTYIPLIGLIIAIVWTGAYLSQRTKISALTAAALTCLVLLPLSVLSYQQASRWQSSITLFDHAVSLYPDNWIAHNNLGDALDREGKKTEAIDHYQAALQLKPNYAKANYNLGNTLASLGRHDEALHFFLTALTIYPEFAEAHNNAGVLLARQKRYLEAKIHFQTALTLEPEYEDARTNLADLADTLRELEVAISDLQERLKASPNNANLLNNLGLLYRDGGDFQQAEDHFRAALRINPNFAGVHNNLGILMAERRDFAGAAYHFQQAVELNPAFSGARINLDRINSLLEEKNFPR